MRTALKSSLWTSPTIGVAPDDSYTGSVGPRVLHHPRGSDKHPHWAAKSPQQLRALPVRSHQTRRGGRAGVWLEPQREPRRGAFHA